MVKNKIYYFITLLVINFFFHSTISYGGSDYLKKKKKQGGISITKYYHYNCYLTLHIDAKGKEKTFDGTEYWKTVIFFDPIRQGRKFTISWEDGYNVATIGKYEMKSFGEATAISKMRNYMYMFKWTKEKKRIFVEKKINSPITIAGVCKIDGKKYHPNIPSSVYR